MPTFNLYYTTPSGVHVYNRRSFSSLEDAQHLIRALCRLKNVWSIALLNPFTGEVCLTWTLYLTDDIEEVTNEILMSSEPANIVYMEQASECTPETGRWQAQCCPHFAPPLF